MEILNYPNYLIYNDGRVYNKKYNRFLKPIVVCGYLHVDLYNNNVRQRLKIHRLVALHYLNNVEGKDFIDHIDRDKTNNKVSNLRWVNRSENQINRMFKNNTNTNHKHISFNNTYNFRIQRNKKNIAKNFKTLTEALCYKFIILLKIKTLLF